MDFNRYSLYSEVSSSNKKNADTQSLILDKAYKLVKFQELEDVKQFLSEIWGITTPVYNHILGEDCKITVEDSDTQYSVVIICKNKNIMWNYSK